MTCNLETLRCKKRARKSRLALLFSGILLGGFAISILPSQAQIDPDDGTLGTGRSQVEPLNNTRINITGGVQAGTNLFHSFREFSVLTDQSVYFTPELPTENILTRVTGANPSNIFGRLGVEGTANLWLINPRGIVFGEEASLDIEGSFYATTGGAIALGNGIFSAVSPESSQLLSVPPEVAFANYLTAGSGDIENRSTLFNTGASGRNTSLTLAGGAILSTQPIVVRENIALSLIAYNNIETTALRTRGADLTLMSTQGDISTGELSTRTSNRSGNLSVIAVAGGATVGEINTRTSGEADAGSVQITAAGSIETDSIRAQAVNPSGDAGDGGDITLQTTAGGSIRSRGPLSASSATRRSDATDSADASDAATNAGTGGDITISTAAGGNITTEGAISTLSRAFTGNAGDSGNITLEALSNGNITNNSVLRSQSDSNRGNAGESGNITISAADGNILNRDALRAQSDTLSGNAIGAGDILLAATNGSITNESDLVTRASTNQGNAGNGGSITVTASGNINNQGLLSSYSFSRTGQTGDGGDINIRSVDGGSVVNRGSLRSLSASNEGNTGNGGSITITAVGNGSVVNNGALNAQSLANGVGNAGSGGNITLRTENGDIVGRGTVAGDNGGSLNVRSVTREGNTGNAGNIEIVSEGGNIALNAYLDAKSYSLNGNSGNGGDVTISTQQGSISGRTVERANIITSAVSSIVETDPDGMLNGSIIRQSRDSGDVTLTAGDRISGLNIFTLSNLDESGDVSIVGTGNLRVEDIRIITNEDIVGGSFSFDENPLFPSNLARNEENRDIPTRVNIPQSGTPGDVSISSSGNLTAVNLLVSNSANSQVNAGQIRLSSPGAITLIDSQLETDSVSTGGGGTIAIENARSVVLDNTALITRTTGEGSAGDITVEGADYVLLRNGSLLLADAEENRDGGPIRIVSRRVIASPNGNNDIITNASGGNGGSFFAPGATLYGFRLRNGLTTARLRSSRSNDISTSSEFGRDGSITLSDITDTPNQIESEELDASFATSEQLISNSCISPNSSSVGSFTIPGAGDLPASPEDSAASVYSLGDVQVLPSQTSSAPSAAKPGWALGDPIVEPESISRLADGRIVFGQSCRDL